MDSRIEAKNKTAQRHTKHENNRVHIEERQKQAAGAGGPFKRPTARTPRAAPCPRGSRAAEFAARDRLSAGEKTLLLQSGGDASRRAAGAEISREEADVDRFFFAEGGEARVLTTVKG